MWTRKAEAQVTWLPGATLPLFFHYSLEFSITFTSSLLKWLVISMTTENSTSSRTSLSLKRKGILISRTFWLQISKISSYCMASFKVCFCNSPVALCVCVCMWAHTHAAGWTTPCVQGPHPLWNSWVYSHNHEVQSFLYSFCFPIKQNDIKDPLILTGDEEQESSNFKGIIKRFA